MKRNKVNLIAILAMGAALYACSSGSSSSSNSPVATEPQGPINYKMFVHSLLSEVPQANTKLLKGTAWTEVGNVANLNPFATLAYQTVNLIVGSSNATTVSTNQIYSEELNISNQITSLQNQLTNDQNIVYGWYLTQISANESGAEYAYNQTLSEINGIYSYYTQAVLFADDGGPYALESVPSSGVEFYYDELYQAPSYVFQEMMQNLTNSQCASTPYTNWDTFNKTYPYGSVGGPMATLLSMTSSETQLVKLLQSLQQQLAGYISAPGQLINGSYNVSLAISQYNQTLETIYQNTVVALQQMYVMEASGNYFQSYSSVAPAGNIVFKDCFNSFYSESEPTNPSYTYSQAYLVQLYADRINSLYQTINFYMVSDIPMIPLNKLQESYALEINGTTPAKSMYNPNNGESIVTGWQESGLLYQESSMMAYKQCNEAFKAGESLNSTNCPQLMPNMYNGFYNGQSITAYLVSNNSYKLSGFNGTTTPFNFSSSGYCNPESGIGVVGAEFFCNNWSGSLMANSITLNANVNLESVPALQNLIASPQYLNYGGCYYDFNFDNKNKYTYSVYDYNGLTCSSLPDNAYNNSHYAWYGMANNTSDSYTYYVATSSQGENNFMLLGSSTFSSSPNFVLGAGEFYTTGSESSFQLEDGGFGGSTDIYNNSASFSHSALLQVTLPNGYNFPFYILSYIAIENPQQNDASHTYSSPLCPAVFGVTTSGITSCTQQSLGNGGLAVTTVDGNTYYLNVLQPSDGQEMQYGYLQINTTPQTACNSGSNACTQ